MKVYRALIAALVIVALCAAMASAQKRKVRKPGTRHKQPSASSLSAREVLVGGQVKLQLTTKVTLVDAQILDCDEDVPVRFQRKIDGKWDTLKSDRTSDTGVAKVLVADNTGNYRAVAPKTTSEETGYDCFRAVSDPVTHSH